MSYRAQIAAELRAEMAVKKYTVTQLASDTEISRSRLTSRLMGHTTIDTDELVVIAQALNLSAADIMARALARSAA
jgi:transcriptional regulator with XRE-family HTH domain